MSEQNIHSNHSDFIGDVNNQARSCGFVSMQSQKSVINDWEVQSLAPIQGRFSLFNGNGLLNARFDGVVFRVRTFTLYGLMLCPVARQCSKTAVSWDWCSLTWSFITLSWD